MKLFKYETHVHTSESSACASSSGVEQARLYRLLGYDGIIITDHFFNGNSCVPRKLPWEERVERFALGFEHALEDGKKIGLTVFFGWEESFHGTDFLVYGLDKKWLLDHPDMLEWDIPEHYARVHADGGYLVHAHPFREASYIEKPRLFPECEDAIEVINASHTDPMFNKKAAEYAKLHNKPVTSGSDAHHALASRGGMTFQHELMDIQDFISSVNNKKGIKLLGK